MRILLSAYLFLCSAALAQQAPPVLEQGPALESFMDGVITSLMDPAHFGGTVCTIVKNGEVIFARGYGYADVEAQRPVDPAATQFEVGSVSKLFVGAAVMQLVEQGKLDLNADVNTYLKDFQVPEAYGKPITLKNLVTHTPGLDEKAIGMEAKEAAEVKPLGEYLKTSMPPRVRPPGEVVAYSNHGVALAAYIVEVVAGQDFADYAQEHILAPLDMKDANFRRPEPMQATLAASYQYEGGHLTKKPADFLHIYPSGSLAATGMEMTHFMIAHLKDGEYNGNRILQPETAQRMHARQFSADPRMPGVCVNFFEEFKNGRRAIWHDGAVWGFATLCYLVPEEGVGIFLSNNGSGHGLPSKVKDLFMDRYFPKKEATVFPPVAADFAARMAPFAGCYRPCRFSSRSIEKLQLLLGQPQVLVGTDGTLTLLADDSYSFKEVAPFLFQPVALGDNPLYFTPAQPGGRATLWMGPMAFEQIAWWEGGLVQPLYLVALLLLLTAGVLLIPLQALGARFFPPAVAPRRARLTAVVIWLACLLHLTALAGLLVVLATDTSDLATGMTPPVVAILTIGQAAIAVTLVAIALVAVACYRGAWTRRARVWRAVFAAASAAVIPFMWYWNLIGWNW